MAIYSFNHDSFGKTTNRAGAAGGNAAYNARENETRLDPARQDGSAGGNAAYNAREEATYAVRSHIIPPDPKEAEAWFRSQEQGDRKNARMSDRFIGALPRELTPEQCIEAVEKFCRNVTQDRVPWHFALHLELDKRDEPDWNPHAHIIVRDRDIETGKRFLNTSSGPADRAHLAAKGITCWTTRDFREEWGSQMNGALERAGHDARIDHHSLKEQGIDREPQIHVGPGSQNAAQKGHQFQSVDKELAGRTIPYSLLDEGSRAERNARIVEANRQPDGQGTSSRHAPEQQRLRVAQTEARRDMYADQKQDRDALRVAQAAEQQQHRTWARELYAGARQKAFEQVKDQTADQWKAIQAIDNPAQRDKAAEALKQEQKNLYAKTAAARIAELRPQKNEAWEAMKASQQTERLDLRASHREEFTALTRQHVAERIGIAEQRRAQQLQRNTNRVSAGMSGHQGMANQQKAAVQAIRLKQTMRQPSNVNGPISPSRNPAESAKAFLKTAFAEHDKQGRIREALNAKRQTNRLRAATPQRFRAQAGNAMQALARVSEPDQQSQLRQAAQAGRALSSEERANASPEVREKLDQQNKAASRAGHSASNSNQQQGKGKDSGRSGGGRGR